MAISLGELVAAAKQANDQPSVMDRWQNTVNHVSGALGSLIGYIKGTKMAGGMNGQQGNNGIASILNKSQQ